MRRAAALGATAISLALASSAPAPAAPWLPPIKRAVTDVWAVGDGADGSAQSRAVASLVVSGSPDRFLYLGDVYRAGTDQDFALNYAPMFGSLASRTAPVIGNHEWDNRAQGFLPYWREARGRTPPPWYALKASGWQLLALSTMEPLGAGTSQSRWLQAKLRRSERIGTCRIAFMHHPRFSASLHGDQAGVAPLWRLLRGRARIALAGHDHSYQRFRPVGGVTQVISGAGGARLYQVAPDPRLAAFVDDSHGAVRIELRRGSALLEFIDIGGAVRDRTTIGCRHKRGILDL